MILDDRFWSKVDKTDTCWNWIGSQTSNGYGEFVYNKKKRRAHILSWMTYHQQETGGLFVCHECDNPLCVNPEHLFLGTQKDNMHDAHLKGRTKGPPPGEEHPQARISYRDVLKIRADKRSTREIGKDYGISHSHVVRIKKGDKWKVEK